MSTSHVVPVPTDPQGRTALPLLAPDSGRPSTALGKAEAESYAEWFAVLADPTRVRLLHTLSTSTSGAMRVGDLAAALGVSQSTCSHHVDLLRKVGFVVVDKVGTSSLVSVNVACCTGLPHAADVVMGTLSSPPCCPEDLLEDVTTRVVSDDDMPAVLEIYAEGLATLHLRIGDETNLELSLERPTEYRLPQGRATVSRIALYAEDPRGFMDEVRRHIG